MSGLLQLLVVPLEEEVVVGLLLHGDDLDSLGEEGESVVDVPVATPDGLYPSTVL